MAYKQRQILLFGKMKKKKKKNKYVITINVVKYCECEEKKTWWCLQKTITTKKLIATNFFVLLHYVFFLMLKYIDSINLTENEKKEEKKKQIQTGKFNWNYARFLLFVYIIVRIPFPGKFTVLRRHSYES